MICPWCRHGEAYYIKTRSKFKCKKCNRQFSEISATPLRGSKLEKGKRDSLIDALQSMSAREAAEKIGVQYRTAWRFMKIMEIQRD
jgi:transposase-like protein